MELFDRVTKPSEHRRSAPTTAEIDRLLCAQLLVAWAGEAGEDARLGWWKSDLVSEFGGQDLFARLLPHTWKWAVMQGAREAARRRDSELRAQSEPIVSLFNLGFAIDERVEERLLELKRTRDRDEALPELHAMLEGDWDRDRFLAWVRQHGEVEYEVTPIGRRLRFGKAGAPASLGLRVDALVAALAPLGASYSLAYHEPVG